MAFSAVAYAGNPQRTGSAGAPELLINPFARSAGWGSVNLAGASGMDALYVNIAGLANAANTEVSFNNTQWLVGSDIQLNAATLVQRVSPVGVMTLGLTSFDYGDLIVTTEEQPEGTGSTVNPTSLIINLGYSQLFTDQIRGGVNIKMYNSTISNLNASGVAFDAGVQYHKENFKFGITLRNVGPGVSYQGDGMSVVLPVPTFGVAYSQSFESRSALFELPTQLGIGIGYDYHLETGKLTAAGSFVSNAFEKDTYHAGIQYSLKDLFQLRVGYMVYDNRGAEANTSAISGFSGGFSFDVPTGDEGKFAIDYAYRSTTSAFSGIHTIGARITL